MPASADDTRRRILDSASAEFATYGIAGARTGRIAREAGVNETLLFRYFGNKQALFERVFDALVVQTVDDVPMDAADLPGYAGALFDYYQTHQTVLRLSVWAVLEGSDALATSAIIASNATKRIAIAGAQAAGTVSDELPPGELLALVLHLSLTGSAVSPPIGPRVKPAVRRASIVSAVQTLIQPR